MNEMTPEEWAKAAYWAERRFHSMRHPPTGPYQQRVGKQAERDRRDYPGYMDSNADPLLLVIRFMVLACGIPFQHAEAHILKKIAKDVARETASDPPSIMRDFRDPDEYAAHSVKSHGDIFEALHSARLNNQASKGTPDASFWNDVVRALRTAQFAPLKTTQRAEELDEEDDRKERRTDAKRKAEGALKSEK